MGELIVAHLANDALVIALIEIDDRPALGARDLIHMHSSLHRNAWVRTTRPQRNPYRLTIPARADKTPQRNSVRTGQDQVTGHGDLGEAGHRTRRQQLQAPFKYDHVLQLNSGLDDGVVVIINEEVGQHA